MSSSTTCAPLSCNGLAAAQLLGGVLNWFLYGALVVQFYVYSYNFSQEDRYFKKLVYSIFVLETVQTILSGADLYYWFAAGFGNTGNLTAPFASFFDVQIMGSVVSLSVQFFFVYRIWVLSEKRSWWLCVIICLFSIIGASAAFAAGVFSYFSYGFLAESLLLKVFEMTWIAGNTLSDLLIASTMLYHLRRVWTRHGNLSSHILVRIVKLTVETNLVTTTVSIVALLMASLYPWSKWYVCPTYILGKLYSNSLLVSLNSRISTREEYAARGAVVDCQIEPSFRSSVYPEATTDAIILEPEKPRNDCINQPVAETEVEEKVNTPATAISFESSHIRRNRH